LFLIFRDFPEWWVVFTLDGYESHLNVVSAMPVFHDNKIRVIEDEGDASDTNKMYDRSD
jgi:hypothetical protein